MSKKPKFLIVSMMKNEGPYILEWVAHHLSIGVEHFLIFSNDCDDGTDRILDRLSALGYMTHAPNPRSLMGDKGAWQVLGLRYARYFNVYKDSEWMLFCDVDEYLQLNTDTPTIAGFLDQVGETDVVSFTSIPYNSDGKKHLSGEFTTSQFSQRNKPYSELRKARQDSGSDSPVLNAVKTLFRNDIPFRLRRNHRPLLDDFSQTNRVWRDGSGNVLDAAFTDNKTKAVDAISTVQFAQLNHYAIRSIESYLVKADRGDVMGTDRLDKPMKYWNNYNTPGDEDLRYIEPSLEKTKIFEALLQDPELKELHDAALEIHRAKVKRILDTETGQALAREMGYFD